MVNTLVVSGAAVDFAPSSHPGMGAIPFAGGTTFRVWAPFAVSVKVTGDFSNWSTSAHPLVSEGNGYWTADVSGARAGHQYKFIISDHLWKNDPYARDVTNIPGGYNSVICDTAFDWGDTVFQTPPWNEMVIYEMHIGTFNEEHRGDVGTLDNAIRRLDYLKDLGINAIQIMPPMEVPFSSWGYNPSFIFSVESDLGNPRALKEFVKQAHRRGIAVIVDVVYNHFGPDDLDLWRFDGWSENGFGGIFFYNDWRAWTPYGDTRPDYGRVEVRRYIRDNALMWLNDYQMDGLRWDSTVNIRTGGRDHGEIADGWSLMQWINNEIDSLHPWKISIAEDLQNNEWLTKESGAGGAGFDSQWDTFVHPVRAAIITPDDESRDIIAVREALCRRYNGNLCRRIIYTESHDEDANGRARIPQEIWPGNAGSWFSRKRSTLGGALVFTAPGIPMIFQGQEFLEDEYFRVGDPLDWNKTAKYSGILNMYCDLIRLRRNWFDTTRGLRGQHINVHHLNNNDKVLAFHRWENGGPGDDVIVVANFANRTYPSYTIGFPRHGLWKVRFNSDWNGYSSDFGNAPGYDTTAEDGAWEGMPYRGNIGIGPYSVLILSQ